MSEERDFDYVVGKLPRKDKDGNDTTGDRIGKGGRHRGDGTYSAVAYDLTLPRLSLQSRRSLSTEKLLK